MGYADVNELSDLDSTTPDGSTEQPSVLDNAIKQIKILLKKQYGIQADASVKSGAYTATNADTVILCDATGGAFTITLPAVAGVSGGGYFKEFVIVKVDASANAITVDGNGAETIDGSATTTVVAQYDSLAIVGNGDAWYSKSLTIDTANIAADAVTTAKILDANVTGAKISTTLAGPSSQNINATSRWTPAAGIYIMSADHNQVLLEVDGSGISPVSGVVIADGTNIRIFNSGGGTKTVYYRTLT
jgi:hypothetical protein